jgi:hypothetical protein
MSGSLVPYHLRPNKAIDRQLFVELLSKVNRFKPVRSYTYVGFGGSFLEDFKLIHSYFGNRKMISIEQNANALKRQKFNLPLKCIKRRHESSGEFIASYSVKGPAVIWLDYTSPKEIRLQVQEYESLISRLQMNDVVKITLNANPEALRARTIVDEAGKRETTEERNVKRLQKLSGRLQDYLPQDVEAAMMTIDGLPQVLSRVLEFAANKAMKGRSEYIFQPLSCYVYSDSEHQMLTITGIILARTEMHLFFGETAIKKWRLSATDWKTIRRIKVPELTAREKFFIDKHLPAPNQKKVHKKLNFLFDEDETVSLEILESYATYYRYYPSFHRVVF